MAAITWTKFGQKMGSKLFIKQDNWKIISFYHGFPYFTLSQLFLRRLCIPPSLRFECLKSRSLIRLTGPDTSSFLQGLITNDIGHFLHHNVSSLFAMFLNQQGRVLFDAIVYNISSSPSAETFLLECDSSIINDLIRHLKLYKVRKKVEIFPVSDQIVWSIFFPSWEVTMDKSHTSQSLYQNLVNTLDPIVLIVDPRHAGLGYRLILPVNSLPKLDPEKETAGLYIEQRYSLGIGEGVQDHPPEKCFPLECNLDYLHGISFHKGCYIGQELTARIHHTGVVRKRLMPVHFEKDGMTIPENCIIQNEKNENVGRFRIAKGLYGLALLRISESLNSRHLILKELDVELTTKKPFWWPVEANKN